MLVIVLIVMLVKEGRKNQKEFEKEQAEKEPEEVGDPLDAPINLNPMLSSPNDYTFEEPSNTSEQDGAESTPQAQADGQGEIPSQSVENPQNDAQGDASTAENADGAEEN